jgi:NAD(P)H-hydrate repair Nnr-like enzyme with NAD(P)H-hydrate epimerase domain
VDSWHGGPPATDLVVDGIVGIGGRGGLRTAAHDVLDAVERLGAPTVAVDVPSGSTRRRVRSRAGPCAPT